MRGPPVERSQCVHQRRAKIADGDREQHEDNESDENSRGGSFSHERIAQSVFGRH